MGANDGAWLVGGVGLRVGEDVGGVGDLVGDVDGLRVGFVVGDLLGVDVVGDLVGTDVVGDLDGIEVVGVPDGVLEGVVEGLPVVGDLLVGASVPLVGVGANVVIVGDLDGAWLGASE